MWTEKGKNFRLLFMVDEVGQYIGDDGDLMINLQSLVEEIGTRCMGKSLGYGYQPRGD